MPGVDLAPVADPGRDVTVLVTPGPRRDWFADEAWRSLVGQPWTVTSDSNRVGLRLEGEPLERTRSDELPSEGLVRGALQVPPSGKPVLFLADHPVTGGYPVIAYVDDADVDRCAQLRPGQQLLLREAPPHGQVDAEHDSEPGLEGRVGTTQARPDAFRPGPRGWSRCQPWSAPLSPGTSTRMNSLSSGSAGLRPEFGRLLSQPTSSRFPVDQVDGLDRLARDPERVAETHVAGVERRKRHQVGIGDRGQVHELGLHQESRRRR